MSMRKENGKKEEEEKLLKISTRTEEN